MASVEFGDGNGKASVGIVMVFGDGKASVGIGMLLVGLMARVGTGMTLFASFGGGIVVRDSSLLLEGTPTMQCPLKHISCGSHMRLL